MIYLHYEGLERKSGVADSHQLTGTNDTSLLKRFWPSGQEPDDQ